MINTTASSMATLFSADDLANGDVVVKANGQLLRPQRLRQVCSDSSLIPVRIV